MVLSTGQGPADRYLAQGLSFPPCTSREGGAWPAYGGRVVSSWVEGGSGVWWGWGAGESRPCGPARGRCPRVVHKRQGAQVAPNLVMRRRPAAARATSSADFPFRERSPQGMRGVVLPFEMGPDSPKGTCGSLGTRVAWLLHCRGDRGGSAGAHPGLCWGEWGLGSRSV